MHAKGVNIPIPSTEEIISIVCISSEASKIASMEKCFTIIDKEIEELNQKTMHLQEEHLRQIVAISNRHKELLQQRAVVEEAVLDITSGVLRRNNYTFNLGG